MPRKRSSNAARFSLGQNLNGRKEQPVQQIVAAQRIHPAHVITPLVTLLQILRRQRAQDPPHQDADRTTERQRSQAPIPSTDSKAIALSPPQMSGFRMSRAQP
jgi:hypothetical protein